MGMKVRDLIVRLQELDPNCLTLVNLAEGGVCEIREVRLGAANAQLMPKSVAMFADHTVLILAEERIQP